jgi:hypothetical protein
MPQKSIKRASHCSINCRTRPDETKRYTVAPPHLAPNVEFITFSGAKECADSRIRNDLFAELDAGAKWKTLSTLGIPHNMRIEQVLADCWFVYPTIERPPKILKMRGKKVPSLYMIRLFGETRWRRVYADWDGNTVSYFILVRNAYTLEVHRIDLQ